MRASHPVMFALLVLAQPVLAQNTNPANPPAGIIQSFDGKVLTIKMGDGKIVAAPLASDVRLIVSVRKTLADIKPGDFVASGGTKGPDGKLHANEIRIIAAPTPAGEGQFPMAQPGQVMTNATVKQVMTDATVKQVGSAGGLPMIKLSFHGAGAPGAANCTGHSSDAPGGVGKGCTGDTEYDVPANVPVVAWLEGNLSMLKPGARANMTVANGTGTRVILLP
jgi:hypothetical protein